MGPPRPSLATSTVYPSTAPFLPLLPLSPPLVSHPSLPPSLDLTEAVTSSFPAFLSFLAPCLAWSCRLPAALRPALLCPAADRPPGAVTCSAPCCQPLPPARPPSPVCDLFAASLPASQPASPTEPSRGKASTSQGRKEERGGGGVGGGREGGRERARQLSIRSIDRPTSLSLSISSFGYVPQRWPKDETLPSSFCFPLLPPASQRKERRTHHRQTERTTMSRLCFRLVVAPIQWGATDREMKPNSELLLLPLPPTGTREREGDNWDVHRQRGSTSIRYAGKKVERSDS